MLRFYLIEAADVVQSLLDHVCLQLLAILAQLLDYLLEERHAHAVDVVIEGVVERLEDEALVYQCNDDLVELLQSLEHV